MALSGWRRALARFGFAYWILFCSTLLPMIFGFGTSVADKTVGRAWTEIGLFVGRILGIDHIATQETGSGDRTIDWLILLAILVLAILATGIWTGLDRDGRHDERVRAFVRLVLRYSLGFMMLFYGLGKIDADRSQFPPPSLGRLTQPIGTASPMGILWTFMGASQAYTKFAGIGEIIGGALLFTRRTTLAGALLLIPVMTNVVMLNFCYDVPVKINASHYLAMAIMLVLPDARRVLDAVLLRRPIPAAPPLGALRFRGRRAPVLVAKTLLIVAFLVPIALRLAKVASAPTMWFDGYWEVDTFTRNGTAIPPVITDKTRWARMKFETDADHSYMRWHLMDRSYSTLYALTEQTSDHLTFKPTQEDGPPVTFALTRPDADHLALTGKVGADTLTVTLHRMKAEKMALTTRDFHWISEFPYNR